MNLSGTKIRIRHCLIHEIDVPNIPPFVVPMEETFHVRRWEQRAQPNRLSLMPRLLEVKGITNSPYLLKSLAGKRQNVRITFLDGSRVKCRARVSNIVEIEVEHGHYKAKLALVEFTNPKYISAKVGVK